MTAQRLWVSQKGQDVFSQLRPPHIHTLVERKQAVKCFSLPSGISAPAYRSESTTALPSGVFLSLSVLKITTLSPQWLQTLKQMEPTAVCFAVWHIPTPVSNIVSCRGVTDLKMLATVDSLSGHGKQKVVWLGGETILLNSPTSQVHCKRCDRRKSLVEKEWSCRGGKESLLSKVKRGDHGPVYLVPVTQCTSKDDQP